ncbi:hypothetical protein MMC21_004259 [Puttea exsequens]|nr:hypothetical protein [Puttea exsequens]
MNDNNAQDSTEQDSLLGHPNPPKHNAASNERNEDPATSTLAVPEPSHARLTLTLSSVWIGAVLASIDSTIVATLLVPISSSFSSFKTLSWIGSAYLITQSVSQPLSGRLTDIFGRRTGLLFCNACFGVGTILCGVAKREWVMILGRAVAGLGGGGLLTISMFVAGDLVPLRNRGFVQGILNVFIGAGAGLGGLLGGWLDSVLGWRVAFIIQVPLVVFGCIMVALTVRIPVLRTEKSAFRRVDYLGSLTLTVSLVLLLIGVNSGGNLVPWSHPLVVISLPTSAVCLGLFILVERNMAGEPIIPIRLLLNRTVVAACFSLWFTFMAFYGITYFMPVYLQLLGNTPTQAGLRFIASSSGTAVGAFGVGFLMRITGKYSALNIAAHGLMLVAYGLMAALGLDSPAWQPFVYLVLFGLGLGSMLVTTMTAMVSAVEQDNQAVVTSAGFAFRSTGSAIGLTLASATFQNLLMVYLQRKLVGIGNAESIIDRIRDDFGEIEYLDGNVQPIVKDSYMEALRGVFLLVCGMGFLAAFSGILMRQHKLHTSINRR